MFKEVIRFGLKEILKVLIKCFMMLADTNKNGKLEIAELKSLFNVVKAKVKQKSSKKTKVL